MLRCSRGDNQAFRELVEIFERRLLYYLRRLTADEQEAVRIAMDMETKSYKFYMEAAETAADDRSRQLFQRLAREENQHYEMLENTFEYLTGNKQWFLWNEWALIVGDQSSIGE